MLNGDRIINLFIATAISFSVFTGLETLAIFVRSKDSFATCLNYALILVLLTYILYIPLKYLFVADPRRIWLNGIMAFGSNCIVILGLGAIAGGSSVFAAGALLNVAFFSAASFFIPWFEDRVLLRTIPPGNDMVE